MKNLYIICFLFSSLFITAGYSSLLEDLKEKRNKAIEEIKKEKEEGEKRREESQRKEKERRDSQPQQKHPYDFFSSDKK